MSSPEVFEGELYEDEIDDLLYLARIGDLPEILSATSTLCERGCVTLPALMLLARDPYSKNGALHMAAANGHLEVLTALLPPLISPADSSSPSLPSTTDTPTSALCAKNNAGNTPLHYAALNGHLECVQLLLYHGADPLVTNEAGHDVLYEAEINDKSGVVEWVLREQKGVESGVGGREEENEGEGSSEGHLVKEGESKVEGEDVRGEMDRAGLGGESKGS